VEGRGHRRIVDGASMGRCGRAFARCPHLKIEMWGTRP
jgi:hypothetical protein